MPFEQWRDVGLSGYGFDGARRAGWRGRNEDRDVAFVDGLYGTGLRLQEWGSVLDVELLRSSTARLFAGLAGGSVPEGGRRRVGGIGFRERCCVKSRVTPIHWKARGPR
ncbi:hypothetical protein ACFRIB_23600 [Streptomyces mirabilis]|uniref:hypothetical protein n=1 Tax=Streptomyces mirabilis TaxID=68239 RepID=UPI0036BB5A87